MSPEQIRAQYLGRPENLDVLLADERTLLADPSLLSQMAGEFFAVIADIRARYNADKITPEQAQAEVRDACERRASIFTGRDERYNGQRWFTPEVLGARLFEQGYGTSKDDAILGMLVHQATMFLQDVVRYEEGEMSDDAARCAVEASVGATVDALLQMEVPT
ncbi:MAG: hypothetical protein KA761_00140 [Gemmatimonadaceae bacterium]|nr:hypothetical protein [Gemmatimonadaceae bacterium]